MNTDNPRFFFGLVHKGEEPLTVWETDKPKMFVPGFGWVFTSQAQVLSDLPPMSRMEAINYLHRECIPCWYAYIVPIEENKDGVTHMWGVWLAGPDDLFVDGTEEARMSQRQIENHCADFTVTLPRDRTAPIEFLRL